MLLIIDAYNLLKFIAGSSRVSKSQQEYFIKQLNVYAQTKSLELIAVFDGGDYNRPTIFNYKNIKIIYSGRNNTADDYIKYYIANYITGDTLVISSDTELCRQISTFGVSCLEVDSFLRLLDLSKVRSTEKQIINKAAQKSSDYTSTPELDALMEETSQKIPRKDDLTEENNKNSKKSSSKTLSKYEKKINKLIKKL